MSKHRCLKCHGSPCAAISREGRGKLYCKGCFSKFSFNIFRTAFTKHVLRSSGVFPSRLIAGISGGRSSMLLLHWLCALRDYNVDVLKGHRCEIIAVYAILSDSPLADFDNRRIELIRDNCDKYGVKFVEHTAIRERISHLYTSSRPHIIIRTALLEVAQNLGISDIIIGGDASLWASVTLQQLMTYDRELNFSFGRTTEISNSSTHIIRPMRDLLSYETALVAHYNGISYYSEVPGRNSQRVSDLNIFSNFLCNMQKDFKSIVFNILRTVDKTEKMNLFSSDDVEASRF